MEYLLIDNLDKLRDKLINAEAPLKQYWDNYLEFVSGDHIGEFQALPPLAWFITGKKRFEKNIRSIFLELSEKLPLADASVEAQFHSYPMGAPVARFAIFLDWIWDSGILSDDERNLLSGRMIDAIYSHCYLRLQGRLPAGDNQQASMSFACAVTGYIFGVKRGSSRIAQKMFKEGMNRYPNIIKSFFPGGWSGEGSTYHCHVTAPVLTLFTAFMEQVTGKDYFNLKLGESTIRENLQVACDIINSAGLLPGWDEYGISAPELKTHLVYLAKKTGDLKPLEKIIRYGMWSENEILAWYNDDKVWSMVFWPVDYSEADVDFKDKSWLSKAVCGKIISDDNTIDLLQMWDIMEGGRPSRSHINPNNIEICANRMIHTVDGKGQEPRSELFNVSANKMFSEQDRATAISAVKFFTTQQGQKLSNQEVLKEVDKMVAAWPLQCAYSTMNAHSVVIIDNEGYKFSRKDFTGHGEGLVDMPSLKAVTGDVSGFYSDIWDISSMRRSSLIINDEFILIHDSFNADKPHKYTWQLMLRPDVGIDGNKACQRLREGGILQIATSEDSDFELTKMDQFGRSFEQQAHRISFDKEIDKKGSLSVVIKPSLGRETVKDISENWSVCGGGQNQPKKLSKLPEECDLSSEYIGKTFEGNSVWFGKNVNLSLEEVENIERLSIAKAQVDRLDLFINGVQAEPLFHDPSIKKDTPEHNKCDGRFWESHFSLKGLFKPGDNKIAIASSEFRGQVISGPLLLLKMQEKEEQNISIVEQHEYMEINSNTDRYLVVPDNNSHKNLQLPQDIKTNAVRVLLGDDIKVFTDTTEIQSNSFTLNAGTEIDIEKNRKGFFIDLKGKEKVSVSIKIQNSEIHINSELCVECTGKMAEDLFIRTGKASPLFYKSECISPLTDPNEFYLIETNSANIFKPSCNDGIDSTISERSAPALFKLNHKSTPFFPSKFERGCHADCGNDLQEKLQASLKSDEWREQVSAAEEIGENGCRWAVDDLVKLFEQEEQKDIYGKMTGNWPFSKMKITFNGYVTGREPEDSKRRYRLKLMIIKSLGQLHAPETEKLILRTLENATDFYPVMVQACKTAGELQLKSALPVLDGLSDAFERNTREASIEAAEKIRKGMNDRLTASTI